MIATVAIPFMLVFTSAKVNPQRVKVRKIVIDAGHGGKDPGCLGKKSMEKDVAFEIAQELGELITTLQKDVEVVYTRSNKSEFIELNERARIANRSHADLFISIHCNANRSRKVYGTETYVLGLDGADVNMDVAARENAVIFAEDNHESNYSGFDPKSPVSYIMLANFQHAHQANSLNLAQKIESQFAQKQKRRSRGVKQSAFLVLAKTAMPSVLIEVGFLTNKADEDYLISDLGKSFTASSIYRAFRDYKHEIERNY